MNYNKLIVIVKWGFGENFDKKDLLSIDKELICAMNKWNRKMVGKDIEVFERDKNIVVTSEGWYGSFFGEGVKNIFEKEQISKCHYPRYR